MIRRFALGFSHEAVFDFTTPSKTTSFRAETAREIKVLGVVSFLDVLYMKRTKKSIDIVISNNILMRFEDSLALLAVAIAV